MSEGVDLDKRTFWMYFGLALQCLLLGLVLLLLIQFQYLEHGKEKAKTKILTDPMIEALSEYPISIRLNDGSLITIVLTSSKPVLRTYWITISNQVRMVVMHNSLKEFVRNRRTIYGTIGTEINKFEFLTKHREIIFSIIRTELN